LKPNRSQSLLVAACLLLPLAFSGFASGLSQSSIHVVLWNESAEGLGPGSQFNVSAQVYIDDQPANATAVTFMVGFDLPGARGRPDTPNIIKGSPEEIAAKLFAFAAEGISHLQIYLDPMTERGIEAFVPVLEGLGDRG